MYTIGLKLEVFLRIITNQTFKIIKSIHMDLMMKILLGKELG